MSEFGDVPGFVEERTAHNETTVVVEPSRLLDAGRHLRDEAGFNFLSDITAIDYLGWGTHGVSGYIGTPAGRDLNMPMTQGYQVVPLAKPKRFAMNYHLLAIAEEPRRLRLQVWLDEGEPVPSVIPVWPTADWHEREAWDLMGIAIDDHPNLKRILLDDDWEGHPLRKDYPIGGEPVRFSGEE
ncbi:MAG TPA: NADH-quinone oxidoreductase subunit C [Gaiellaceae bacterium]|nr:NADH-quinone oxidoreductase subunit C [Gaiellaceae bacterium]